MKKKIEEDDETICVDIPEITSLPIVPYSPIEQEYFSILTELLPCFKTISSQELIISGCCVRIQDVSLQNKQEIFKDLETLENTLFNARIGENLQCWLIYHYFENHQQHHPIKFGRRKQKECSDCNIELYQKLCVKYQSEKTSTKMAASVWVNRRKKIGRFLALLHPSDTKRLEFYYSDNLVNISRFVDCLDWNIFQKMQERFRKLVADNLHM